MDTPIESKIVARLADAQLLSFIHIDFESALLAIIAYLYWRTALR